MYIPTKEIQNGFGRVGLSTKKRKYFCGNVVIPLESLSCWILGGSKALAFFKHQTQSFSQEKM
jgi:hypothetical protein